VSLAHPWLEKRAPHSGEAVIVGGAPSLSAKFDEVRWRQSTGCSVFATNNTAALLRENGIQPSYHVLLDARLETASFITEEYPPSHYLVASQCDRAVFDRLEDEFVHVFHPLIPDIAEVLGDDQRPVHLIGGGSTVGLKSIALAYVMGYRTFHLFGFDSSYAENGTHHAYPQGLNDADRILTVQAGGKTFKAAPWMVTQANEFQELAAQLANEGCTVTIAGDGLIPFVAREMMKPHAPTAADERAYAILSRLQDGPVTGAEIGIFAGDLSARLLSRKDLTLYLVDSWKGGGLDYHAGSHDFHASLSQAKQDAYRDRAIAMVRSVDGNAFESGRAKLLALSSVEAARSVDDDSLDFVFIDADHSYEGCAADIAAWYPKLKPGALLSGHDYDNPVDQTWGVARAVQEFAKSNGYAVTLSENFTWFITKKANPLAAAAA
jgi:Protein of unknown function DUF115/Methyltransferase domain